MCTSVYDVTLIIRVFFHVENLVEIGSPFFLVNFSYKKNSFCVLGDKLDTVNANKTDISQETTK